MKTIATWKEITDYIGQGMGLFVIYSCAALASDQLDSMMKVIKDSEYLSDETQHAIYMDLFFGKAADCFLDHIFQEEDELTISGPAIFEGMEELDRLNHEFDDDEVLSYLRYCLDWQDHHLDWLAEQPVSIEEFLNAGKRN